MSDIKNIRSDFFEIIEKFKHIELNSQILTRYASPVLNNLTETTDYINYYTSDDVVNVIVNISEELLIEVNEFKNKLNLIEEKLQELYETEIANNKADTISKLNKLIE
ncbi:hypothetical protein WEU38_18130 (plasmid) [Cyanobacterium aponinum AL20118]|uniref:Uncharacterized protein n=1 Tax=Cyanobacterium aponinum AL20115 TaxID=3090662 RepID=A0AAF1C6T8_9CHRO|nr:hypothetical protein [Cyanobacterium aponinum]WPF90489.1 hypothetical protein SAY89_18245 [Cyanobacterium aponinum AL20115]